MMNTRHWVRGCLAGVTAAAAIAIAAAVVSAVESRSDNYAVVASTLAAGGGPSEEAGTHVWGVLGGPIWTEPRAAANKGAQPGFLPVSESGPLFTAIRRTHWFLYR